MRKIPTSYFKAKIVFWPKYVLQALQAKKCFAARPTEWLWDHCRHTATPPPWPVSHRTSISSAVPTVQSCCFLQLWFINWYLNFLLFFVKIPIPCLFQPQIPIPSSNVKFQLQIPPVSKFQLQFPTPNSNWQLQILTPVSNSSFQLQIPTPNLEWEFEVQIPTPNFPTPNSNSTFQLQFPTPNSNFKFQLQFLTGSYKF